MARKKTREWVLFVIVFISFFGFLVARLDSLEPFSVLLC